LLQALAAWPSDAARTPMTRPIDSSSTRNMATSPRLVVQW
jgi:hypothetical protein